MYIHQFICKVSLHFQLTVLFFLMCALCFVLLIQIIYFLAFSKKKKIIAMLAKNICPLSKPAKICRENLKAAIKLLYTSKQSKWQSVNKPGTFTIFFSWSPTFSKISDVAYLELQAETILNLLRGCFWSSLWTTSSRPKTKDKNSQKCSPEQE